MNLTVALLKALEGDNSLLSGVKLNSATPLKSEAERLQAQTITLEEIEEWLN